MHNTSPATLTAIAYAARVSGDRDLLREARRRLKDQYGIVLTFSRPKPEADSMPTAPSPSDCSPSPAADS